MAFWVPTSVDQKEFGQKWLFGFPPVWTRRNLAKNGFLGSHQCGPEGIWLNMALWVPNMAFCVPTGVDQKEFGQKWLFGFPPVWTRRNLAKNGFMGSQYGFLCSHQCGPEGIWPKMAFWVPTSVDQKEFGQKWLFGFPPVWTRRNLAKNGFLGSQYGFLCSHQCGPEGIWPKMAFWVPTSVDQKEFGQKWLVGFPPVWTRRNLAKNGFLGSQYGFLCSHQCGPEGIWPKMAFWVPTGVDQKEFGQKWLFGFPIWLFVFPPVWTRRNLAKNGFLGSHQCGTEGIWPKMAFWVPTSVDQKEFGQKWLFGFPIWLFVFPPVWTRRNLAKNGFLGSHRCGPEGIWPKMAFWVPNMAFCVPTSVDQKEFGQKWLFGFPPVWTRRNLAKNGFLGSQYGFLCSHQCGPEGIWPKMAFWVPTRMDQK